MFYLRLAFNSIRSLEAHFLRSLLATVGVLIGVGSVVACMSILEGASNDVTRRFKSLGSNVLYVMPTTARVDGRPTGMSQTLLPEDIDTLTRELGETFIDQIAPEALGSATVRHFQKTGDYGVVATSEVYFTANDFDAEFGRVFNKSEANDELATVCCLGSKVAEDLFGGADPVGQPIKVGNAAYRVIGVLKKRGNLGFLNVDETVYIPIKAGLKRFFNRKWLNRLTILAKDASKLEELEKRVTQVLRNAHNIRIGEPPDFSIFNQEKTLQEINQFLIIWKVVFYSIAGISLVVGGIGIMNIMLVSVTERTREIGVRIAVGARRTDILLQFLVEALVISVLGGGFGLMLGAMCSDIMNNVLKDFNFVTEITPWIIFVAVLTTTAVGVFSGIYPAWKASRLDPVEALRYE